MSSNNPNSAVSRLKKEYLNIKTEPVPYVIAEPLPSNIHVWHYVVIGPEDTPYQGGYYHGILRFPAEYPFKPPSICMITPNGRFKPNTRLCLSMSDFHPESWNASWSVSTILTGLLSFMVEEGPATGCVKASDEDRRTLAEQSLTFNLRDPVFFELFPGLVDTLRAELKRREELKLRMDQNDKENTNNANNVDSNVVENNNAGLNVGGDRYAWFQDEVFVFRVCLFVGLFVITVLSRNIH